jgi:hypothetical protein
LPYDPHGASFTSSIRTRDHATANEAAPRE